MKRFYTMYKYILINIQILSENPTVVQSKGCAIQILHPRSKFFAIDQNYEQHVFPEAIKTEHHVVNW